MKRIIAIIIAFLLLATSVPLELVAKEKNKKKHKKSWIYRFLHKRHDRLQKWNTGHTEFKNRTKKEQKRISKHHLDPNKPIKEGKKQKNKQKDIKGKNKDKEEETQPESQPEPEPQPPAQPEPPKEGPK